MNNIQTTFETLISISLKYPDFEKIRLSAADYLDIISDQKTSYLLDINMDTNGADTGFMATLFGKKIFVSQDVQKSNVEFFINSIQKWSIPIRFDQLEHVNKILKLQAFY